MNTNTTEIEAESGQGQGQTMLPTATVKARTQTDFMMDQMDGDATESVRWERTEVIDDGGVPPKAFLPDIRGFRGEHHYIGLHRPRTGSNPQTPSFIGPVIKGKGLLKVPGGSDNEIFTSYEILTIEDDDAGIFWQKMEGMLLPDKAFYVYTKDMKNLYIGKHKTLGIGTVMYNSVLSKWTYSSHKSDQAYTEGFEIMCLKDEF